MSEQQTLASEHEHATAGDMEKLTTVHIVFTDFTTAAFSAIYQV